MAKKRNLYAHERVSVLAGVMLPTLFIIIIGLGYGLVYNKAAAEKSAKMAYLSKAAAFKSSH